jgi:indolepyruvate ferredoxin oxidoreductase
MLARLKFLRGTKFDVFGYSAERRAERKDLKNYLNLIELITNGLDDSNYQDAVTLATLPKRLRGFGYVRSKNRMDLALEQEQLLNAFRKRDSSTMFHAAATN